MNVCLNCLFFSVKCDKDKVKLRQLKWAILEKVDALDVPVHRHLARQLFSEFSKQLTKSYKQTVMSINLNHAPFYKPNLGLREGLYFIHF